MAYDEELVQRLRDLLADEQDLSEMRMFGGLAFLLAGNMAVAASGREGLMVRVKREEAESLLDPPQVTQVEMRGRPMRGWIQVAPEALADDGELAGWVERGAAMARSLPPK